MRTQNPFWSSAAPRPKDGGHVVPLLWEVPTPKHCVSPTVRATAAFNAQGVYNSVCLSLTNRSFLTADHKALKQSSGLFSSIFNDTSSLNTAINCLSSRSQEVTCFLSLSATSNLPSDLYETAMNPFTAQGRKKHHWNAWHIGNCHLYTCKPSHKSLCFFC